MKTRILFLLLLLGFLSTGTQAAEKPTALELIGKWEGAVQIRKFNFKLVLRVAQAEGGRLAVTLDVPDQGQKGLPVNALLFNYPDVRVEIDQFGTAFNGKLSESRNEIAGAFEEGPEGRPAPLVFKRSTQPDLPEPERIFTFSQGEARDIRGYWKGSMEAMPGMKLLVGLNIGRLKDGTFRATLDLPEQGARDIPASSVTATNRSARLQWDALRMAFNAELSDGEKELVGKWIANGRTNAVSFERLDERISLVAKSLSFEPDSSNPEDVRGHWKGTLEVPGAKLRLAVKIGRSPDGSYGGTLVSLDQGATELPMTSASFDPPKLKLEWKGIRGTYEGTLAKDGKTLDGKWEQAGNPMPLKLERTTAPQKDKKS